ncbi:MAG TPA: trimeric intracellular cation channel family protein [Paludibacter sp.]|nr:trimeric intracellular cation channel family protein [Paludibacter sp.]
MNFIHVIDYAGTFAFAISGIRLASAKQFDWFGAYVVGLVTAIGGGTLRDLLLDVTPFWMSQPSYLVVTGMALLFVIAFGKLVIHLKYTFFIFDAIGLGLFVVVGIEKSLTAGFPFWVSILMGMITGSVGGVVRDMLINEVPLIFRKDIYALACVVGGIVYFACAKANLVPALTQALSALSVILVRVVAVYFHISLPVLKGHEGK